MPRVYHVKKARKDHPEAGIKAGESYFYWSFRFGGTHKSKTYPKPSQLTQSEFLINIYSAEEVLSEAVAKADCVSDIIEALEQAAEDVRQAGEDCQEKLYNMPEGLQEGDVGQLLQERADRCDELAMELEDAASCLGDGLEEEEADEDYDPLEPAREAADGIDWAVN